MRIQLRIVAGALRGRKLTCNVSEKLRPAPQMLREALFSILGDAIPGRPFFDLFAGTGAVGLEAISRGAYPVTFVERDFRTASAINKHLQSFGVADQAVVVRADVYRWVERWPGAAEPVNVFLGPPYPDFENRLATLMQLIADVQAKVPAGSIVMVQSEDVFATQLLPMAAAWDQRSYGRNQLLIWVKETSSP